jgi:hypothetical protein
MAAADNIVLVDATSGARSITLPAPTNGRVLFVVDFKGQAASHNITVLPHASETINSAASYVISQAYGSAEFSTDGTNWVIIANGGITGTSGITQLTGDVTAGPGSGSQVTTLATVNSNVGSFGSSTSIPSFTVNAKGLITAASGNVVIAPAGTLSGTTLNSSVVSSSLTSVGTLTSLTVSGTIGASNFSGSSSGTNSGDVTLAAFGSTPNADGLSLSAQVLNMQPADGTHPGGVSITTQTFAGSKTIGFNASDLITIGASGSSAQQQINGGLCVTTNTVSSNYAIV